MLTFKCNTCQLSFPAEIAPGRTIYMDDNRRIELKSENDDCEGCQADIAKEASAITEEARARVRARKEQAKNGQQG